MVTTPTTSRPAATLAPPHRPGRVARVGRLAFGAMFTGGAAIHVVIVLTGTETYRHFADTAFIPFVEQVWLSVFMPHAALLGLLLFGWGFWFWSVPMLAMLVALLRYDFDNALGPRRNQRTEMRT